MLYPEADWRPVSNYADGAMRRPMMGLVLHHSVGPLSAAEARFNDRNSSASAHFGNPMDGTARMRQWVDTDDVAWAQVDGNWTGWVSVENESLAVDIAETAYDDVWAPLNDAQLDRAARLLAWLHDTEGVPIQVTDTPAMGGLAYHSMAPPSWGQTGCPGQPIIDQRQEIVRRALGGGVIVPVLQEEPVKNFDTLTRPGTDTLIAVRGPDDGLYVRSTGMPPDVYAALGGVCKSAPKLELLSDGGVQVFVVGADAAVHMRELHGFEWGPWVSQGGRVRTAA